MQHLGLRRRGPFSQLAAIDGPVQAFAGLLELTGHDGEPGMPIPMQVADIAGASYATQAVLAGLLARERSGRGTHVELSMAECVLQWLGVVDRSGTLAPPATLVLEAAGGERMLVQAIMHFHPKFAALVAAVPGLRGLRRRSPLRRPRGPARAPRRVRGDRPPGRPHPAAGRMAGRPPGGRRAAAPIHGADDVLTHPQLVHRGAMTEVDVPGHGPTSVLAPPFTFDGERRTAASPPPRLGEHTRAVLVDWLDWTDDQLAAAAAAGAFGPAT